MPIPAALATGAVHHHLIRQGLRMQTGLVVETGEAREVHHFCVLAGYGAEAINPYLAFETIARRSTSAEADARANYIKAVGKGMLKVMSKMGISTYQSYCGAQIFDAIGLSAAIVDKYFTGTATVIEGVGIAEIAEECARRHRVAYAAARSRSTRRRLCLAARRRGPCLDARRASPTSSMRCAAICPKNTAPSPRRSTSATAGC